MDKANAGFLGGMIGLFIVIVTGTYAIYGKSPIAGGDEIRIYQREQGKPNAMRLYRTGADGILVEDPKDKRKYIALDKYLETIQDEADRNVEKAEIEKIVEWYNQEKK